VDEGELRMGVGFFKRQDQTTTERDPRNMPSYRALATCSEGKRAAYNSLKPLGVPPKFFQFFTDSVIQTTFMDCQLHMKWTIHMINTMGFRGKQTWLESLLLVVTCPWQVTSSL
jgi:hypothetical protein